MKKTLNLLMFSAFCFSIMAFTPSNENSIFTLVDMVKIYEDNVIAFSIESTHTSAIVQSKFDHHNDNFQISTQESISLIQVLDVDNKLQFQMPLGTNEVHLEMEDFEIGMYQISFQFEDNNQIISTTLLKKG